MNICPIYLFYYLAIFHTPYVANIQLVLNTEPLLLTVTISATFIFAEVSFLFPNSHKFHFIFTTACYFPVYSCCYFLVSNKFPKQYETLSALIMTIYSLTIYMEIFTLFNIIYIQTLLLLFYGSTYIQICVYMVNSKPRQRLSFID